MTQGMTIEQFNALLKSDQQSSPLLNALRKLTTLSKPAEVVSAAVEADSWHGWSVVQ